MSSYKSLHTFNTFTTWNPIPNHIISKGLVKIYLILKVVNTFPLIEQSPYFY